MQTTWPSTRSFRTSPPRKTGAITRTPNHGTRRVAGGHQFGPPASRHARHRRWLLLAGALDSGNAMKRNCFALRNFSVRRVEAGFTLAERLGVVPGIGLVAGLPAPTLSPAKARACRGCYLCGLRRTAWFSRLAALCVVPVWLAF